MLHLFYVSLKYRNIVLAIKRPQYSIMKDHKRIDLIIHSCSYKLQVRYILSVPLSFKTKQFKYNPYCCFFVKHLHAEVDTKFGGTKPK